MDERITEGQEPVRLTPELLREMGASEAWDDGDEDERDAREVMRRELRRATGAVGAVAVDLLELALALAALLGASGFAALLLYATVTGSLPAWLSNLM